MSANNIEIGCYGCDEFAFADMEAVDDIFEDGINLLEVFQGKGSVDVVEEEG
jgi:hypothetical protein